MNNKCQIVWIYGPSGAGKETFIRYIIHNPSEDIISRLGWQGKKISYIKESVDYIGQYFNDPIVDKRKIIVDRVKDNIEDNDIILIKGQDVDFEMNILNDLKKLFPENTHKIIYLYPGFDNIYNRCLTKSWYKEEFTREMFIDWAKGQLEKLKPFENLGITALDSSDKNYKSISYPPNIK